MRLESAPFTSTAFLFLLGIVAALPGCGKRDMVRHESFQTDTPFSAKVNGRGEDVCWSVKRALLTQGYMLDRGGEGLIMIGSKDLQPDDETNVSLRLQATCVDNRDGTSTVFASASRETSKMQTVAHSTTYGASIATISLPSGTDKALRVQRRETIQDPKFYRSFYALVQSYASEETNRKK
jgi:hypothetical protein